MTTNDEILITIDVDAEASQKKAKRLADELKLLRKEKTELIKMNKAGKLSQEEFEDAMESLAETVKETGKAHREAAKDVELEAKARTSATGSLNQLRAQLSLLTPQYAALSKAQRDSSAGIAFRDSIRDITEELKKEEKALGDNRRNVGNYGDALKNASNDMGLFGGAIGNFTDKLGGIRSGLESMKVGLTGIKGAIAATGIGVLLLVLGAVYSMLTKTQGGMDKVAQATSAVGAVFTVLIDTGVKLAQAFTLVFTAPTQAIARFKEILTGIPAAMSQAASAAVAATVASQQLREEERKLLVQRAKSRAEIERLKFISEDVSKSEEVRIAAARAAFAIEDRLMKQQIALQGRRIAVTREEAKLSGNKVEDLDRVAEAEVRLAEIQEESRGKQTELNNKVNELRIQSAQNRIAREIALEEDNLQYALSYTEYTEGEITRVKEDQYAVRRRLLTKQEEFELAAVNANSKQADAIRAKFRTENSKLDLEEATTLANRVTAITIAELEEQQAAHREGSVKRLKLELEVIDAKAEAERQAVRQTIQDQVEVDAKLKAINAKRLADRKEISQQIRDEEIRLQDELIKVVLAKAKEGSAEQFRLQLIQLKKRREAAIENTKLEEAEKARIIAETNKEEDTLILNRQVTIANRITESLSQAKDFASKLVEAGINRDTKALEDQQKVVLDNALLTADQRAAIEKEFAKKKEKLEIDAAKKRKKIATVENVINTAKAITAAYTAGPIGPVLAALAAAVGIAQQVVIESAQFALGGVVTEPKKKRKRVRGIVEGPGTTTSDSVPAELSKDEAVMTAKAVARNYDELSAMNVDGGGVPFPGAKPVVADPVPVTQSVAPRKIIPPRVSSPVPSYMSKVRAPVVETSRVDQYTSLTTINQRGVDTQVSGAGGIDPVVLAGLVEQGVGRALDNMPAPRLVVSDYERVAKKTSVIAQSADV